MKKLILNVAVLIGLSCYGQSKEIGGWRDYLPYNNAIGVAKMDGKIYVATDNSLFYLNEEDQSINRLSKINGLSDVGISVMAKDPNSNTIIVAYNSTKIDIVEKNNIHSILDLERENIVGGKTINNISFYNNNVYLSCSFGILELNVDNKEVANTYYLSVNGGLGVNDLCVLNDSIYAATDSGLLAASLNDNLLDYQSWRYIVDNISIRTLEVAYERIYFVLNSSNEVYCYSKAGMDVVATIEELNFIKADSDKLFIGAQSKLIEVGPNDSLDLLKESSYLYRVSDVIADGNKFWLSDGIRSLVKIDENKSLQYFQPSGPLTNRSFSTFVNNDNIFLSPGGISILWDNNNTYQGFHWSDRYSWRNIPYSSLGGARDITNIIEGPSGNLYVGTWNNGVLELKYNDELENYILIKEHNFETSNGGLQTISNDTNEANYGWLRIKDMIIDQNGLLWITNSLVEKGLAHMNVDGDWLSYNISSYNTKNSHLGDIIIDNQGKKWFIIAKGGGIIVYDDNGSPEDINDDNDRLLTSAPGQGNLPSNTVYSIALDNDGEVWVGTDNGIGVFYQTSEVFGLNGDCQQILVETDGYVEPIITNESVTAIAIDGANRKWLGTKSSGVFVYSPDGRRKVKHFTEENSPILSNKINHISIDDNSGEVFISTEKGLISYKGEATAGGDKHGNVIVYPNPVKENYNGPIAIKNVVENSDIKITDIRGNLIKTTTAFGGQAIWDGKNKNGKRASTGVYLVFSTNSSGLETNVAKILFIK
ncbi:MAG: hypothetical protein CMP64_02800 [Flavobacteriales bacterium]|nr:hypothetical protein [Flavobacteriales bacterium]